jgi:anaerobic selenocysteine-containing dehydrogenase
VIKYRIAPLGLSYEEYVNRGCLISEKKYHKYEETGFATPTGKVELYATVLEQLGYDPLPHYEEPPESPVRTPELLKAYPLILTTGSKFMPMFHSEHRQPGVGLRERHPDPLAHIHPETAGQHDIQDGNWIYVETARGRIKLKADVTESILQGVVDIEASWWFPEKEAAAPSLFGALESNANVLTIDDPDACDPMTGSWCNRGLLCKIYKV